ncbi:SHOCT domain-containing protein [Streptomyces sp. NPDC059224]|uniref:SHOCT domain-containing protein n=1 Tax=Streptomyces sp. NPDC059224 TaxID=3346775 RepID=UPI0036971C27
MNLWYGRDPGGWSWMAMSVGMVLFWAALAAVGVLLFRALSRPAGGGATGPAPPTGPTPERVLADRFARGEIDGDEYRRRLAVLRADDGPRLSKG